MKKFKTIIQIIVLMTIFSSALFSAGIRETAVLKLTAYIPAKTTFTATDFGFDVATNNSNFTYSVLQQGMNKTLYVVAD